MILFSNPTRVKYGTKSNNKSLRRFCAQASKKKVYMLYNVQPDRSVTGGAWYSDQDFESEFVEVLNQQCFKFLHSKVKDTEKERPYGLWRAIGC